MFAEIQRISNQQSTGSSFITESTSRPAVSVCYKVIVLPTQSEDHKSLRCLVIIFNKSFNVLTTEIILHPPLETEDYSTYYIFAI